MSWLQLTGKCKSVLPAYEEIINRKLMVWEKDGDDIRRMLYVGNSRSHETNLMVSVLKEASLSTNVECYVMAQAITHGPKIFRPDQLNCEAMEHIQINIDFDSYVQPYPTMIVELPVDYLQKSVVPCDQAGEEAIDGNIYPTTHQPDFVIVHWEEQLKLMFVAVYMTSGQVLTHTIFKRKADQETIEQAFMYAQKLPLEKKSIPTNDKECIVSNTIMRVGINACSLLMELGCRKIGAINPAYYERAKRYVQVNKKKGPAEFLKAQRELRLIPMLYGFEQEVKLYHEETEDVHNSRETGRTVSPHWRKGHRQWYHKKDGPVRKFKKPILVNKHLYGGTESNTNVVYKG